LGLPDAVASCTCSEEAVTAMLENRRHRDLGDRHWWTALVLRVHAVLLVAVLLIGGGVAMATGHSGSGEAGVIIGGVIAVVYLAAWARRVS
jgi:hypothetical protein